MSQKIIPDVDQNNWLKMLNSATANQALTATNERTCSYNFWILDIWIFFL